MIGVGRIAALYDVHGNLPALEATLGAVSAARPDLIVVGGDVFPGPLGAECLARLAEVDVPIRCICGNGERETLAAVDGQELISVPPAYRPLVEWGARQLRPDQIQALRQWPLTVEIDLRGVGPVLFCHATPRSDTEIFTRDSSDDRIGPAFEGVAASLVVCGHTHMAFDRRVGRVRVVNAGSVGMPFGQPGAHWLWLDASGPRFMHTPYDLADAAARIRATAYPGAEAFAADHVLRPPSEEAMLAVFERR